MKQTIVFLFVSLFTITMLSAQIKKAAIISVFGSRNLSDNPMETKIYEALMKDTSFNLDPIVDKFDNLIREQFVPQFPFPFVPKETVVGHPEYVSLIKFTKWATESWYTTSAKGYIPIAAYGIADDEEAIKKSFSYLPPDVDAVMIAYIDFSLFDEVGIGGFNKKKIKAYVNLKMFDKDANRIFKLKENANSDTGLAAYGGFVLETDKIMPMIESASNNLFEDMKEKLPKSLNKMAKKLAK